MRDKRQETRDKRVKRNIERRGQTQTISVRMANYLVATLLVLVPFHAFLTVWGSTLISGSYTWLRLWTLLVLVALATVVGWWLLRSKNLRRWFMQNTLIRTAVLYMALTVLVTAIGVLADQVSPKAALLGIFLNLRFVLFFIFVTVVAHRSDWLLKKWRLLLLVPGLLVVIFAVLQYLVLPVNFLSHFGYGTDTIPAYATINNNKEYIRVASTLRGANPLGAYLVLIISALAVSLRGYDIAAIFRRGIYLIGAAAALLFSFSRSAWLGVVLALVVFGFLVATSRRARLILGVVLLGFGLVSTTAYIIAQDSRSVQNAIFHTDDDSKIVQSSNDARLIAQSEGLRTFEDSPFGRGAGAAGPSSVYNQSNPALITENYFLQLAIETGWPGVLVFLFLLFSIAGYLWTVRTKSLAMVLLMSLAGLTLINMLSHAWTDETVAFIWWGLAGVAAGTVASSKRRLTRGKAKVHTS